MKIFTVIILFIMLLLAGSFALGVAVGYKAGLTQMAEYMLGIVGKVNIHGNITVGINETKIDQAIEQMKNITIQLLNKTVISNETS